MRIIALSLAVGLLASCSGNDAEVKRLQGENDSLRTLLTKSDSTMNSISETYGEIEKNAERIEGKKALINKLATRGRRLTKQQKEYILLELDSINQLLEVNRQKVAELEIASSTGGQVAGMDHIIKSMNEINTAENKGLDNMKRDLAQISSDFSDLFEDYVYTEAENLEIKEQLSSTSSQLEEAQAKLESTQQRLYTAWYVVGTKEELKAKGIVYTSGLFANKDVNEDFDKKLFRKINTLDFKEIILSGKKAIIITTHPSESYELQGIKKKADKMVIKDPEKFWSVSKFLIVEIE
ncbi:MAG: hypothetical protein RIC15_04715 [Vicingaceae bacterium]